MNSYNSAFEIITKDRAELSNYKMRLNMMNAIMDVIEKNQWTQKEAAEQLDVSQPRISNLKKAMIDKFSADMLMQMLAKVGIIFDFNYNNGNFSVSISVDS